MLSLLTIVVEAAIVLEGAPGGDKQLALVTRVISA